MKNLKVLPFLIFVGFFQCIVGQTKPDTITAIDALKHIGQNVIVKAKVVTVFYAKNSNGKPTFLNVDKDFPDNPIAIIIFEQNLKELKNRCSVIQKQDSYRER